MIYLLSVILWGHSLKLFFFENWQDCCLVKRVWRRFPARTQIWRGRKKGASYTLPPSVWSERNMEKQEKPWGYQIPTPSGPFFFLFSLLCLIQLTMQWSSIASHTFIMFDFPLLKELVNRIYNSSAIKKLVRDWFASYKLVTIKLLSNFARNGH